MRLIPHSEHDSYYSLDDVEIWEVKFKTAEEILRAKSEESDCEEIISTLLGKSTFDSSNLLSGQNVSPNSTAVVNSLASSPIALPQCTESFPVENASWGPLACGNISRKKEVDLS